MEETSIFAVLEGTDFPVIFPSVRPVHHRSDGEAAIQFLSAGILGNAYFHSVSHLRHFCGISGHSGEFIGCRGDVKGTRSACPLKYHHGNHQGA